MATFFSYGDGRAEISRLKSRQFLQFKADFHSLLGEENSRLDYLQFAVTQPPMASSSRSRNSTRCRRRWRATRFIYKILPQIQLGESGFDTIEIRTPIEPRIESVSISGTEVEWAVLRVDATGLEVRIPRIGDDRSGELIRSRFEAEVFRFGTVFPGAVWTANGPTKCANQ